MPLSALTPPVAYFCAIGMGFMLIEISQMQRLMVFLGHPVYGLSVVLFTILLFSGIGSTTVGAYSPRPGAVTARVVALLTTLAVAGLMTPLVTSFARSEATDMRVLWSALLLAPPAFCMGMMFPLGLSIWRRHAELLPFFWSANGITSMFASVLGMALSVEFGIAKTYVLGMCFYVVCALMIVVSRQANRAGVPAAGSVDEPGWLRQEEVTPGAIAIAPSIQPAPTELVANIPARKPLESSIVPARAD
jgi:hypothetical protein